MMMADRLGMSTVCLLVSSWGTVVVEAGRLAGRVGLGEGGQSVDGTLCRGVRVPEGGWGQPMQPPSRTAAASLPEPHPPFVGEGRTEKG